MNINKIVHPALKKYFSLLLCLVLAGAVYPAAAQQRPGIRKEMMARLKAAKWAFIVYRLNLSEQRANKLLPVYEQYEGEKRALFQSRRNLLLKEDQDVTDEEAAEIMDTKLENARKLLEIKEKYQKEFLTVLSAEEVLQLQRAEQEFALKVQMERQRRKAGRK